MKNVLERHNIVPLLAPVDIASTVTATPYVDLKYAQAFSFYAFIGNINSGSADTETITIEAATAPTGTEAAIAFTYRKSGAVGANTWAAAATAGATGVSVGLTDDNLAYLIDIDPDALAANDYRYVRLKLTDVDDMAALLVSVTGFIETRFAQATHLSATAAASA